MLVRIGFAIRESINTRPRLIEPYKALTTLLTVDRGHIVTATGGRFVRTEEAYPAIAHVKTTVPKNEKVIGISENCYTL